MRSIATKSAVIVAGLSSALVLPSSLAVYHREQRKPKACADQWIYPGGGGYFGVPLSNSLGWMLTVFTIVALFELWRLRQNAELSMHVPAVSRWRLQIPLLLGLSLLPVVLPWLSQQDRIVTDPAGVAWHSSHIYESTVLVGLHTPLLFALVGIFVCLRHNDIVKANAGNH